MSANLNENNAAAFEYKSVRIHMLQGRYANDRPLEIGDLVFGFTYFEDITKPFISANLNINDTGMNLIGSGVGPITGNERVEIVVTGPDGADYIYNFRVYRVGDRIVSNKLQNYNLGLISSEALADPRIRIRRSLTGRTDEIVRTVLTDDLGTSKDIIADPSLNQKKLIPKNLTPFAICAKLQDQSIPRGRGGSGSGAESSDGKLTRGIAGYFFFENANGYNFRSIDSLMDVKGTLDLNNAGQNSFVKTFEDSAGENESDTKLIDVKFTSEINMLHGLRTGAYALRCQFYNFSTGDFDESTYSASDTWFKQSHLGSQDDLTPGQKTLSNTPTRIISAIIDDESYYSGQDSASESGFRYKDQTPNTLPQAISRNYLLNTQGVRVTVPGNLQLVVGDVVRIFLQNQINQEERKIESIDTDHSGFYLVTSLSRFYNTVDKRVTTMLDLKRDSYGLLDIET